MGFLSPKPGSERKGRLYLCSREVFGGASSGDPPAGCLGTNSGVGYKERTTAHYFAAQRGVAGPSSGPGNGLCWVGAALRAVGLKTALPDDHPVPGLQLQGISPGSV